MHKVSTNDTGELMLKVFEKRPDKSSFRRLDSIASAKYAVANDVLYHDLCWASIKQKASNKRGKIEDYSTILADIEITRFIESKFEENKNNAMDTSKLNELFKNILDENDKKYEDISKNYKKHLKNVIHEKMSYIVFVRPKQKNKAEQLISSSKTSEILSDMTDEASTEFEIKLM